MKPFLFLLLLLSYSVDGLAQVPITYPRPITEVDDRTNFPVLLLREALSFSERGYSLEPSEEILLQARAFAELESGRRVDVVWSMTSLDREARVRPIRIPIYKGLIGWRIFLTQPSQLAQLDRVESLEQLKDYSMVQGHDWPDLFILEANGLFVVPSSSYEGSFGMLAARRVDLFPRSVIEIWSEAETRAEKEIVVDSRLLLQYPTAFYYFVNRDDKKLAEDIQRGLEKLIEQGRHICLLVDWYGKELKQAGLNHRLIFKISNPYLPPKTPLHREELWFDPRREYTCPGS